MRSPTRSLAFAFAAFFTSGLGFACFLHFPGFLRDLGADGTEIGVVVGIPAGVAALTRPWFGRMSDRTGRRPIILIGGVAHMIAAVLYVTVSSVGPWLLVVRLIHGVAQAIVFSTFFTVAADTISEQRRTHGLALFGTGGLLPMSIGGVFGDWLLTHYDYKYLFACVAGLATLSFVLSLGVQETRPENQPPPMPLAMAAKQKPLLSIWVLTLGYSSGIAAYMTFVKTFVEEAQIGTVGQFFSFYAGAALTLRLFFGWIPDRFGAKRFLLPALVSAATSLFLLAQADSTTDVMICGLLAGLGHGYIFPIASTLVVSRSDAANRGACFSVFSALFEGGLWIGNPVFGWLLDAHGYTVLFNAAAVTIAGTTLAFFVLDARLATPVAKVNTNG